MQITKTATTRFAAALSTVDDSHDAIEEVCRKATSQLGVRPDLAVLFLSPHHAEQTEELASRLKQHKRFDFMNAVVLQVEERPASFKRARLSLRSTIGTSVESFDYFTTSLYIKAAVGINKTLR